MATIAKLHTTMSNAHGSPNRHRNVRLQISAFVACILVYLFVFEKHRLDLTLSLGDDKSVDSNDAETNKNTNEVLLHRIEHSDTSAPDGFINAWRQDRETCGQWISMQQMAQSYLDAYIIGSQKGATSEITKRLHKLGVRQLGMKKEWHYFNKISSNGDLANEITSHKPITPTDMRGLRFAHYKSGFPDDENATIDNYPLVDNSPIEKRLLAYDSTVEHLHTDKAAFMAHALTPHAKVVATVRDPIERAISQFNMVVRNYNRALVATGKPSRQATADWFHEVVKNEIENIKRCGYNATAATLDRPTSKMLSCIFGDEKVSFENLLYVTRGLYHLHIATWRNYFPDHRILILSFHDLAAGKREAHKDLADFLCIRPFPDDLLKTFEESGSTLSYGQQVANGMANKGTDKYDSKHDSYMLDIDARTRKMLNDFFRPGNQKLEAFLGRRIYDYE